MSELAPGQTVYAPQDILVPDGASESKFNPALSSAHFVGETVKPGEGIEPIPPPPLYTMTAPGHAPHLVHLHWQAAPGAEGYEVFSTPTLDTPFPEAPDSVLASPGSKEAVTVLPAGATDAYVPGSGGEHPQYYAVTTIIGGRATLDHPVLEAVAGEETSGGPKPALTQRERAGGGSNLSLKICWICLAKNVVNFLHKPVDASTGNLWETVTDLSVPGRSFPLSLSRTYNSMEASTNGPFGYGWSFSYGTALAFPDAEHVVVNQEEGSQVTFTEQPDHTYAAPSRVAATLVHNEDGSWTLVRRRRETLSFDASGRLIREADLSGYTTSLAYNESGRLATVTDPAGRKLTFTYSGSHISSATGPLGRVVTYTYDKSGNLTDVTDVAGGDTHFTYDSAHRMIGMRLPNQAPGVPGATGAAITMTYDKQGRVTAESDQLKRRTTFRYTGDNFSAEGGATTITDPKGNVTVQEYKFGELVSETQGFGTPQAATWKYGYDQSVLGLATVTDPDGHTTTSTYDAEGNTLTTTDALGRTTTNTYDGLNDLLTTTDPLGVTTTMTYDAHGNLLTRARPLTGTSQVQRTVYTYGDPSHPGDVTAMTDPGGNVWRYAYDTDGDLVSTTDPLGHRATSTYNVIGWLLSTTSPRGNRARRDTEPLPDDVRTQRARPGNRNRRSARAQDHQPIRPGPEPDLLDRREREYHPIHVRRGRRADRRPPCGRHYDTDDVLA